MIKTSDFILNQTLTLGTANGLTLTGTQLSLELASATSNGALTSADYTKLQNLSVGGVDSINGQTGTVVLSTDNISEGSNNLYFTQARVSANPDVSANVSARHNEVTIGLANGLFLNGQSLSLNTATASTPGAMTVADKLKLNGIEAGAEVNKVESVNGKTGSLTLSTSDIAEGSNAYYTESRVNNNVNVAANTANRHAAATIGTANGLSISGQQISLALATTSSPGAISAADKQALDNLSGPNVTEINGETGSVTLDSDDIAEGVSNLYFTEARANAASDVVANTSARHNPVSLGVSANGLALSGQELQLNLATPGQAGSMSAADKTKLNNIEANAEANAVDSVNGQTGAVVLDTDDVGEGSNLYFTQARVNNNANVLANTNARHAAVTLGSNQNGLILAGQQLQLNLATNVNPGAFSSQEKIKLTGIENGAEVNAVDSVNNQTGAVVLDTDNVSEGVSNLYFTQARVDSNSNVSANTAARHAPVTLGNNTNGLTLTGQTIELGLAASGVAGAMSGADKTKLNGIQAGAEANTVDSVNGQTGAILLTTANINENGNLYYTNGRVNANPNVAANTAARHDAVTLATSGLSGQLSLAGQQLAFAGLPSAGILGAGADLTVNYSVSNFTNCFLRNTLVSPNSTNLTVNTTNGTVVINADGRYMAFASIPHTSAGPRQSLMGRIVLNSTTEVSNRDYSYIRNANNHERDCLNLTAIFDATSGTNVRVQLARQTGVVINAAVNLIDRPFLFVIRIS